MIKIAIQGVSWSGKTTLAKTLHERNPNYIYISLDWYYKEGDKIESMPNKEILTALDIENFIRDFEKLKKWKWVIRQYDFQKKCSEIISEKSINPDECILILEGIHAFHFENIIWNFHEKIFLDVPLEKSIIQRMKRDFDISDPDRKLKPVLEYLEYLENFVLPMSYEVQNDWIKNSTINFKYPTNIEKIVEDFLKINKSGNI